MANQLTTALFVISGIVLVFHLAGLLSGGVSPNSVLLLLLTNPQNIMQSELGALAIAAIEITSIIGAIALGIVTKNIELSVMTIPSIYIFNLLFDVVQVYNVIAVESKIGAMLLMAPMMVMLVVINIDWWRGRD